MALSAKFKVEAPKIQPSNAPAGGRCSNTRLESVVLQTPPARLFFLEKQPKLHPESLSDMLQRNRGGIALPQFETADVGSVYPHALGKLGLR